jgi:hypothetical protein
VRDMPITTNNILYADCPSDKRPLSFTGNKEHSVLAFYSIRLEGHFIGFKRFENRHQWKLEKPIL